jgi:hypothetical protein
MIGNGVTACAAVAVEGDISAELATVTLAAMWFDGSGVRRPTTACRTATAALATAALGLAALAGCSEDAATARETAGANASIVVDDSAAATSDAREATAATAGTADTAADMSSSTVAPEPTGVPGIDDSDPFCAAWAVYSGTVQSIGIANAFGGLPSSGIARIEVIAAASLVESVGGIGSRWPAELVGERSTVLTDLVGPFDRRAQKAVAALRDAGVGDDELAELAVVWMTALRERTAEDPVIAVPPLRDDLAAKVDAAAAAFDAAVTPFADDPSLIVESVETPLTDAYLSATCPDLASSGVGDAI